MQYQVLVQPQQNNHYIASVLGVADCVAEGATKEMAVANAKAALERHLAKGEIVTIELETENGAAENPWLCVLGQLDAVMQDDDYDEDYLAPTESAYGRIKTFLHEAYKAFGEKLQMPYFTPDGDGGLRLRWIVAGREVRLLCPAEADKPCHVYFEEGEDYGAEQATADIFLNRLKWLLIQ